MSNCRSCQYIGDKYSFSVPNDLVGADPKDPTKKRLYCCCGDSPYYEEDIAEFK